MGFYIGFKDENRLMEYLEAIGHNINVHSKSERVKIHPLSAKTDPHF